MRCDIAWGTPGVRFLGQRWLPWILGSVLAGLVQSITWAGPPYVTDDPETPARHGWEINVPYTRTVSRTVTTRTIPLFDVNYGYLENLQIKLEVPILSIDLAGMGNATGLGDTLVGVKWRLIEEKPGSLQLAVYPQIGLPTGDSDRGLGSGSFSYVVPILLQKNRGKWTGFGNAGYVVQTVSGSRDYAYYGAAITRQLSERLDVGAELFGNTPTSQSARSDLGFNLGAEWTFRKGRTLLASAGHGLSNGAGSQVYAGLQIQLGPGHRHHRKRTSPPTA